MKTSLRHSLLAGAAAFILGLAVIAGCGMKGPPLPPINQGNRVAAPQDLAYTRDGDKVVLTWSHAVDPANARVPAEAFKVFVAVKGPEDCEGCPFIFKETGIVAVPRMQFSTLLQNGVRHYFRVQAVGSGDKVSDYSKTLLIDPQTP